MLAAVVADALHSPRDPRLFPGGHLLPPCPAPMLSGRRTIVFEAESILGGPPEIFDQRPPGAHRPRPPPSIMFNANKLFPGIRVVL